MSRISAFALVLGIALLASVAYWAGNGAGYEQGYRRAVQEGHARGR